MIKREELKHILEHAILAPSMLNTQPWMFKVSPDVLSVIVNIRRSVIFCDPNQYNLYLSIGAVIENIVLTAGFLGYECLITPFPQKYNDDLAAEIRFRPKKSSAPYDPLYHAIPLRKTNRKKYSPRIVLPEEKEALSGCFDRKDRFKLIFEKNDRLNKAILLADKLRFSNPDLINEFIEMMKPSKTRTGLSIQHLRPSWGTNLLFDLMAKTWIFLNCFGSYILVPFYYTRRHLVNTSSIGWFITDDVSKTRILEAGRAMQRILLKAAQMGIQTHVINFALIFLEDTNFHYNARELEDIREMRNILNSQFLEHGRHAVFVFRLGYAKRSTASTSREPLESFLWQKGALDA